MLVVCMCFRAEVLGTVLEACCFLLTPLCCPTESGQDPHFQHPLCVNPATGTLADCAEGQQVPNGQGQLSLDKCSSMGAKGG